MEKVSLQKKVHTSDRGIIPEMLTTIGAKKGVEIGVFKGEWSRHVLQRWNGTLYMIDPWRPLGKEYEDASNHANHMDAYERTMESIRGFEDRAFMLRGLGEQLVEIFEDESLDYVYIDGNHTYDYVKQDMELWWPKLKKGGLFAGHDYLDFDWSYKPELDHPNMKDKYMWTSDGTPGAELKYAGVFGVNPAVDEFCETNNIEVLNLTNEWAKSWFFIK
jgi:hypothetical protein